MNDKKRSSSSSSELTAEMERIEHAKKIIIDVLDKGILELGEVGSLAIDLARYHHGEIKNCGCDIFCGGCKEKCPCPEMGAIEEVVQPGQG